MKRLASIMLVPLLGTLTACSPPTASPAAPAVATTLPSPVLGHFRLSLTLAHDIAPSSVPAGTQITPLKTYPTLPIAQADFYLPEGATSQSIATLPDGNFLSLQFTDLHLSPTDATAQQYGFDANFKTASAVGPMKTWPYMRQNSTPPPRFLKDQARDARLFSFGFTANGVSLTATTHYQLTYLGLTTANEVMALPPAAATVSLLPTNFTEQANADLKSFALPATQP